MADATTETTTWPELAISLYDKLTGRGARIHYEFDDLQIQVPSKAGDNPDFAPWKVSGKVTIHTDEK
ncbi:MAG: hypothetical protein ACOCVG_02640 [Verrucomicrobiota bacterium]